MTHLTNAAIRQSLKDGGLGDEKLETYEFGEIREYATPSCKFFFFLLVNTDRRRQSRGKRSGGHRILEGITVHQEEHQDSWICL
jgi:hypothetical protein